MTTEERPRAGRRELAVLLFSIFGVAACGVAYELLIGAIATYLLGASVFQFSITIGLFLSAMGLGAWLSRWIHDRLLERFVAIEVMIGILGGSAGALLFAAFAYTGFYSLVMYAVIITIAAMTGLEIPLLTRYIQERHGSLREAISNVLSFDYLGALLASLVFPLVLLPTLGLLKTSVVVGLMNVGVAALTLFTFRRNLHARRWLWALVGLGFALLVGQLLVAKPMASTFEQSLYRDEVVFSEQSRYQKIVLTRYRDDVRLYLDGSLQLSSRDEHRYHESLVHPAMAAAARRHRVLVLGGGDGCAVREVLRWPDVQHVALVDIDEVMTRVAKEHPMLREQNGEALDDPRVEVISADAFNWLRESSGQSDVHWDVILADFPDPRVEAVSKLYSVAFYGLLERHLAPGGAAAVQATSPLFARKAFWCVSKTAQAAGLRTTPYHAYVPSFGEWGFVLMSRHTVEPKELGLPQGLRFLNEAGLPALFLFPPDIASVEVEPSTLDAPIVLDYYREGWDRWF